VSLPLPHPLPSSLPPRPLGWWDRFVPQGSVPLLLLWLVLAPLALLTAESLLMPLAGALQLMSQGLTPGLGFNYWVKLTLFLVLSWLGVTQVSLRLQVLYTAAWSRHYPRPHPTHVDYVVALREAMLSVIAWHAYRWLRLIVPPVVFAALTIVLSCAEIALFNTLLINPALSFPIPFILGLFLLLSVALITVLVTLRSLSQGLRTLFGSSVAITEPDLPLPTLFDRCLRLTQHTWWVMGLLAMGYLSCWLVMLTYVAWLLLKYNIETLVMFQAPWWPVLLATLLLMAYLITFQASKWHAYHQAMVSTYHQLDPDLLATSAPPPTKTERWLELNSTPSW
jgi:hypothetical protein